MEQSPETFDKLLAELTSTLKEKLTDSKEKGEIVAKWGLGEEYHIYRETKANGHVKREYIALIAPKKELGKDSMSIVDVEINVCDKAALQSIEYIFTKYLCPANIKLPKSGST